MSFWGSLGKIALQAAPYVAAPFTGGASLYAVPATKKLGQKWSEHDNAERAKKGLGPSNFDKYLNIGSNMAEMGASATGFGGDKSPYKSGNEGSLGNRANSGIFGGPQNAGGRKDNPYIMDDEPGAWGGTGGISGNIGSMIQQIMNRQGGGQQPSLSNSNGLPPGAMNFRSDGTQGGQFGNYGGYMRGLGPVMGRRDQNNPNLAESIGAGRQDAIRNQPFRGGYDVLTPGPEPADDSMGNIGPPIRNRMPPIYPTGSSNRRRYMN